MLRKILEIAGGYVVAKVIFKAGEAYGEYRSAVAVIKKEANDLRTKLDERD